MDNPPGTFPACHIARLPYELRQRIFGYALKQKGTVGLRTPVWDDGSAFKQPLFGVCHSFRDEALEAFYTTNTFLWHIHRPQHVGARPDADPSKYPLEVEDLKHIMTPSLPWHYPRLMKDLRRLALNVFLPSNTDYEAWSTTFPQELQSLVASMGKSAGLRELQITIITGYWRSDEALPLAYLNTMGFLGRLRVFGAVKVRFQPSRRASSESINSLGLEKKIKA